MAQALSPLVELVAIAIAEAIILKVSTATVETLLSINDRIAMVALTAVIVL